MRALVAWSILFGALLIVFAPALGAEQVFYYRDHSFLFQRLLRGVVDSYAAGHWPLWDPYAGGGEPLAAYPAALAWSPLTLIFALPGTFETLYDVFVVAHYPVAAVGAYGLARVTGCRPQAAVGAALVYALSGVMVSLNNLLPALSSAAFGPLALAAAVYVAKDPVATRVAALGLSLGLCVMATDPVMLVCNAVVFMLAWVPGLRAQPLAQTRRAAVGLGAGAALGALVAGVAIIPVLDLLQGSLRGTGFAYDELSAFSLHPLRLAELFLPGLAGDYGPPRTLFSTGSGGRLYLASLYAGASVLPLLILAAERKSSRRWLIGIGIFAILALGRFTPLHRWLVGIVPGLDTSRMPVKLMYGAALCTSLAAGLGLEALFSRAALNDFVRRRVMPTSVLFAALCTALMVFGPEWTAPFRSATTTAAHAFGFVAGAASAGLLFSLCGAGIVFGWSSARLPPGVAAALLGLVIALDLGLAARPLLTLADRELLDPPAVAQLVTDDARDPAVFLYAPLKDPPAIANPTQIDRTRYGRHRLEPGAGSPLRIRSLLDSEVNDIRPPFWYAMTAFFGRAPEPVRLNLLGRMGITHLLVEANVKNVPGLTWVGEAPVTGGPPISVFRLNATRPFLSTVHRVSLVPDTQAAFRVATATSTFSLGAVVEREFASLGLLAEPLVGPGARPPVAISNIEHRPGFIAARVKTSSVALIVAAQRWNANWHAYVGGSATTPVRVDGHQLGVMVPPGEHDLFIGYWPRSFYRGAVTTGIGLLLVIVISVVGVWRRRRG